MTNKYITENRVTYLEITRRNGDKYYYVIDKEDISKLKSTTWAVAIRHAGVYAYSMKKGLLHRFILTNIYKDIVDHINRCTFDNRKENLRITNYKVNAINTRKQKSFSGFRYIEPIKESGRRQKYAVNVGKRYRKRFYTLKEALVARNNYIKENEPLIWKIHKNELIKDSLRNNL